MSRLLVQDPDTYVPPSSDLRGMAQRDARESPRHIDWQRIAEERQALLTAALDEIDRLRAALAAVRGDD